MFVRLTIASRVLAGLGLLAWTSFAWAEKPNVASSEPFTLWTGAQDPAEVEALPDVEGVVYRLPHRREQGWHFLHGAAVIHHQGELLVNWAHNPGSENSATELVRGRRSSDDGATWGKAELIAPGFEGTGRHSHGVFLAHAGKLWCFVSNFGIGQGGPVFPGLKTEAFTLNERTNAWESQGLVADNCWPMDAPRKMDDGNWIMGGLTSDIKSCVAISHGDDFSEWDVVPINWPAGRDFLETSVIADGPHVTAFIRNAGWVAVAESEDYGRTWSDVMRANYPMAASQPFADVLSTGQRYLISNIRNRDTLTIAVSKLGEKTLSKVWRIRHGVQPSDYQGEVGGGQWAYPYAYEHEGKLYVVYSVRKLECELAILPLTSLKVE